MTEAVLREIMAGYALRWDGIHGLRHWGRVLENGRRLAPHTGADLVVVEWFAVFHDSRRVNDGRDPGHGGRGGDLAGVLHDRGLLDITDEQLTLLRDACERHTDGLVDADPTVQTCWDADRLDLARVWITPDPRYLCTPAARAAETIDWAIDRSRSDHEVGEVERWLRWTSLGGA